MVKRIIAVATNEDRQAIYELRHAVYAEELSQHQPNSDSVLKDALDEFNIYLVAKNRANIIGFVSITPPGHRYSIDKYFLREGLPFAYDDKLYEIRILTVTKPYRNGRLATLLMYAAFRWVESQGGTRIVGMGRRELMGLYGRIGLAPLGRVAHAGALTYELMGASVEVIRARFNVYEKLLSQMESSVDWQTGIRFRKTTACFHGGTFFKAIGEEFKTLGKSKEIINADVLDAWYPPSPTVIEALNAYLPWLVQTSPPTNSEGLIRILARVRGVPSESLMLGAGSSSLIYLAFRTWLTPASRVLILDPTYGEYAHVLENVIGCRPDRFVLSRNDDYRVPLSELSRRIERGYDLIVLVNPNSPTGQHIPGTALRKLVELIPRKTRIWIDETYVEYAGSGESLESFAVQQLNCVICKSMSKVYALSGARVAYLCASPGLLEDLILYTPPWVIGLPSQVAAVEALQDPGYYSQRYKDTHALRQRLMDNLRPIGVFEPVPSTINAILCHLNPRVINAETLVLRCQEQGLFIRNVNNMSSGLGDHIVRIAVKDEETTDRMVAILRQAVQKPLLFSARAS